MNHAPIESDEVVRELSEWAAGRAGDAPPQPMPDHLTAMLGRWRSGLPEPATVAGPSANCPAPGGPGGAG